MPITRGRGSARQSMRRVIHRQGYLKKLPNAAKFGSRIKKPETRWFVFGVMNGNDPYLEYYISEEAMIRNTPMNIIFLDNCLGVVREHSRQRHANAFTLVLRDRYLTLVAPSRDAMSDWCRTFEVQLTTLGILHLNLRGENDYVDIPNVTRPKVKRHGERSAASRERQTVVVPGDPAGSPDVHANGVIMRRSRNRSDSSTSAEGNRATVIGLGVTEEGYNEETYETLWETQDDQSLYAVPSTTNNTRRSRQQELQDSPQNAAIVVQSRPLPVLSTQAVEPGRSASQIPPTDGNRRGDNTNSAIKLYANTPSLSGTTVGQQSLYANVGTGSRNPMSGTVSEIDSEDAQGTNQTDSTAPISTDFNQNLNKINQSKAVDVRGDNAPEYANSSTFDSVANTQTSPQSSVQDTGQENQLSCAPFSTNTAAQHMYANSPETGTPAEGSQSHTRAVYTNSTQDELGATARVSPVSGYSSYSPVSPNTPNPNVFSPNRDYSNAFGSTTASGDEERAATADSSDLSPEACAASSDTFIPPVVSDALTPPLSPTGDKLQAEMAAANAQVDGWNIAPPVGGDAPPPYMPKGVLEKGANKSLKETQVEDLKRQQMCAGGVKIVLQKKYCYQNVAFIECFDCVWIAGWNQTARPYLSNAFHIGDRIISINGQVVDSAKLAYKLIKQCKDNDKMTFVMKRIPTGKVFLFRRARESQSLGIQREGGTGEIKGVEPNSLSVKHGLFAAVPAVHSDAMCHPYITEINNRPLNLFYKDNEIERLLSAVGREISLVVHPTNLIHEFKKRLKAIKGYKDYLLE